MSIVPVPVDDGACRHLSGLRLPDIRLKSSRGNWIALREQMQWLVLYVYPMSGDDDSLFPSNWDLMPGTSGCSAQHCSFSSAGSAFEELGIKVFGIAAQAPEYLASEVARLNLQVELLSDEHLRLQKSLQLPMFPKTEKEAAFLKRVTMICTEGVIVKTFYPVFPPEENATAVLAWLRSPDSLNIRNTLPHPTTPLYS